MFDWIQFGVLDLNKNGQFFDEYPLPLYIVLAVLFAAVVPYLLGSINTAVLFSRILYKEDIRTKGSGNAGLTNMHRVYGGKAAALVLIGDMLKMILSLFFVGLIFGMHYGFTADASGAIVAPPYWSWYTFATQYLLYVAGLFCILGHIFPVYFKFKGGKGVLCTVAFLLTVSPLVFLILFGVVWILMLLITRYVSVASISVGLLYPLLLNRLPIILGYRYPELGIHTLIAVVIGLLIIYCHRSNIIRLWERRENKFHFHKKKKDDK